MDTSQPCCRAGCPNTTYCLFVVCSGYHTVCLTDEEYDCIQRQVSPAYHPIPVYLQALTSLGRCSYATSNRR